MATRQDPMTKHLEKHGLTELHTEAEAVGYRVRTATDWTFMIEYQGGLRKYQRNYALRDYENTDEGKAACRAFLATVAGDIAAMKLNEAMIEVGRLAEAAQYHLRTATAETIAIEYKGDLPKYQRLGYRLREFPYTLEGVKQCRAYLDEAVGDAAYAQYAATLAQQESEEAE